METVAPSNKFTKEECDAMKEHYKLWRDKVYAARRTAFWFPKIAAFAKPTVSKGLSRFDPRVILRRSSNKISEEILKLLSSDKLSGTDEQKTDAIMEKLDLRFGTLDETYDNFRAVVWPLLAPIRIFLGNLLCQVARVTCISRQQ